VARTNKNSLRLDAEFTEDTVGFALESFLALLTFPRHRFCIEPFSRGRERWLGADARLNGNLKSFKPFYMQFKRPSAYPDTSTAKVIADRKSLKLPSSPHALYFGLREKQDSHRDFQHNILYQLRRRLTSKGIGDATYVCPLFLDRAAYRFHVHMAGLRMWSSFWRHHPWQLEQILINEKTGAVNFDAIPVIREHVSIPPHATVTHAKHNYSFTEQGKDLCFHSPLALPEQANTLDSFLRRILGNPQSDEGFISVKSAAQELLNLFSQTQGKNDSQILPPDFPTEQGGIEAWLQWGEYLKTNFQIEQFALMRWED
jgi:hypothetical protein